MVFLRVPDSLGGGFADTDAPPHFQQGVWPLIQSEPDRVERVYLFKNREFGLGKAAQAFFEVGKRLTACLSELGPLETLSPKASDWVRSYCTGGHLNVFFEIADSWFRAKLRRLWLEPGVLSQLRSDLALSETEYRHLEKATDHIPSGSTWASFAGEGEILFLFGDPELLRALVDASPRSDGHRRSLKALQPAPGRSR